MKSSRVKQLAALCKGKGVLITNFSETKNIGYFTGFFGFGALCITKQKATLFVPEMEVKTARAKSSVSIKTFKKLSDILPEEKEICILYSHTDLHTLQVYRKAKKKILSIDKEVQQLRMIKDEKEIRCIKKACMYTENILEEITHEFAQYTTEQDVAIAIKQKTLARGLDIAFPPIVAHNTGEIHYTPSTKKLQQGFLLIDMGVGYKGYCSDMTRMLFIGRPTKKELEDYFLVRKLHSDAVRACKTGVRLSFIQDMVNKKHKQIHSLGHGVGLDVHESPRFDKTPLQEGMVFTIEPGLYKKYGVRIEDTLVMRKGKAVALTKFSKDLVFLH